jgi:hypothetical protein
MLLDDLMPVYDVVERHHIVVRAAPAIVFASIKSFDLSGSLLTRALLAVRSLPGVLVALLRSPRTARAEARARRAELRFSEFERAGFRVVAERAPEEVVIGVLGRFWTIGSGLRTDVSAAHFAAGPPKGYALAGWNFTVGLLRDGTSELRTETRVRCAADVRAKFRVYWFIIRPGSALIRREILRTIRREAERRVGSQS